MPPSSRTPDGLDSVHVDVLPSDHRYLEHQAVNAGGAPSVEVIERNRPAADREHATRPKRAPVIDLRQPPHAA